MDRNKIEARIFKGTRDFLPERMRVRRAAVERLRGIFESFGFEPLETPAMEFYDILTGKSGEEADTLHFRMAYEDGRTLALRYDLTVPLSRVVAMHGASMLFPFKRYQIQPVWRAEKPQKGRYREFLQCDVDTVGTDAMTADAEIVLVACEGMRAFGFSGYRVALNNRKILNGLYAAFHIPPDNQVFVSRTVDKMDKVGRGEVRRVLVEGEGGRPLEARTADALLDLMEAGDLDAVERTVAPSPDGLEGVAEIREILALLEGAPAAAGAVRYTPSLVRGLDYYTGPIFEVLVEEAGLGSLGGGGRYDGLVALFSDDRRPATGFSFGLERLVDALEDRAATLAGDQARPCDALVTVFSPDLRAASFALAAELRAAGLRAEVYVGTARKLGKQFDFANRRNVPVVLTVGPSEAEAGKVSVKWMDEGTQEELDRGATPSIVKARLGRA